MCFIRVFYKLSSQSLFLHTGIYDLYPTVWVDQNKTEVI